MCVIIYGGNGWIGQQFQKELRQRKIPFHLAEARVGKVDDAEVSVYSYKIADHLIDCELAKTVVWGKFLRSFWSIRCSI
jgi:hypothetical protein